MDDPDELEEVAGVEEDDEVVAVVVVNVAMVGTTLPGTLLVCMRSYFTKLKKRREGTKGGRDGKQKGRRKIFSEEKKSELVAK